VQRHLAHPDAALGYLGFQERLVQGGRTGWGHISSTRALKRREQGTPGRVIKGRDVGRQAGTRKLSVDTCQSWSVF
jgi:hypothetical protein